MKKSGSGKKPAIAKAVKSGKSIMTNPDDKIVDDTFSIGVLIKNTWEIAMKLGAGGFGHIFVVTDIKSKELFALKAELAYPLYKCQLPIELFVMKRCQGQQHASKLIGAGLEQKCNFIVMQLLGPNLGCLRRQCPSIRKRFSLSTSMRLALQGVEALRDLHHVFIVHRDIKPANFAMGYPQSDKKDTLYLLDYGLSRFIMDEKSQLRPPRSKVGFRGTVRYCSAVAHKRQDIGRGDDLTSLFYMIYEFLCGNLPWAVQTTPDEVAKLKEEYSVTVLAKDMLIKEFVPAANLIATLKFEDRPDYEAFLSLLREALESAKIHAADAWDWENHFKDVTLEDNAEQHLAQKSKTTSGSPVPPPQDSPVKSPSAE